MVCGELITLVVDSFFDFYLNLGEQRESSSLRDDFEIGSETLLRLGLNYEEYSTSYRFNDLFVNEELLHFFRFNFL